jgi:hypothetical protein
MPYIVALIFDEHKPSLNEKKKGVWGLAPT